MDPVTAIGLAAGIVNFIEFASELTVGAFEVYKSLSGETDMNAHVGTIVKDLREATHSLDSSHLGNSTHEEALRLLAHKCQEVADELLVILANLKVHGNAKAWTSVKVAWKSRRKAGDIERLNNQLREYRSAIIIRQNLMAADSSKELHYRMTDIAGEQRDMAYKLDDLTSLTIKIAQATVKDETLQQQETAAAIHRKILELLYFESMHAREDSVQKAETGTFGWLLDLKGTSRDRDNHGHKAADEQDDARSEARRQYLDWLEEGSHVFHISGKAGSGKSTLLRYLSEHIRTRKALEAWAGSKDLVFASFYFWSSGDALQNSLTGLYRTILYTVLDQCPDLTMDIFPEQWSQLVSRGVNDGTISALFHERMIERAFDRLVRATCNHPRYRFCFFIDGLDEYRGYSASTTTTSNKDPAFEFKQLSKHILTWNAGDDVKICCSARPYVEFTTPLSRRGNKVIHLDKLNYKDIFIFCCHMFEDDDDFEEFEDTYLKMVKEITQRAEGVFLWALLAVKVLLPSLGRGDSEKIQMEKLDRIPGELGMIYDQLLAQVDETDQELSNRMLLLELRKPDYFNLYTIDFAWLEDLSQPDFPSSNFHRYSKEDFEKATTRARRQMSTLTKGLLEIAVPYKGKPPDASVYLTRVAFFHRTVHDFLVDRMNTGQLTCAVDFDKDDLYGKLSVARLMSGAVSMPKILSQVRVGPWHFRIPTLYQVEAAFNKALSDNDFLESFTLPSFRLCYPSPAPGHRATRKSVNAHLFFICVCSGGELHDWVADKLARCPELIDEINYKCSPLLAMNKTHWFLFPQLLELGVRPHGFVYLRHSDNSFTKMPTWFLVLARLLTFTVFASFGKESREGINQLISMIRIIVPAEEIPKCRMRVSQRLVCDVCCEEAGLNDDLINCLYETTLDVLLAEMEVTEFTKRCMKMYSTPLLILEDPLPDLSLPTQEFHCSLPIVTHMEFYLYDITCGEYKVTGDAPWVPEIAWE